MKRIFLVICALLALSAVGASAEEASEVMFDLEPAVSESTVSLDEDAFMIGDFDVREIKNQCGCKDLCKNDKQCERTHGPGAVCLPDGPCGCRECFATW